MSKYYKLASKIEEQLKNPDNEKVGRVWIIEAVLAKELDLLGSLPTQQVMEEAMQNAGHDLRRYFYQHLENELLNKFRETSMNIYIVTCYRASDIQNVVWQLKKNGVRFWTITKIPFWNIHMQIVGEQYAFIYQHTEELNIEVQT